MVSYITYGRSMGCTLQTPVLAHHGLVFLDDFRGEAMNRLYWQSQTSHHYPRMVVQSLSLAPETQALMSTTPHPEMHTALLMEKTTRVLLLRKI